MVLAESLLVLQYRDGTKPKKYFGETRNYKKANIAKLSHTYKIMQVLIMLKHYFCRQLQIKNTTTRKTKIFIE